MRKKKKEKELSPIEEKSLSKLGGKLGSIKDGVKKHSTTNNHASRGMLECENNESNCDKCIFREYPLIDCEWYQENRCTYKCKSFANSIDNLGFVDLNKIRHHKISVKEHDFRKKLLKYLIFSEKVDKIYEDEIEKLRIKKKKDLIRQKLKEMRDAKKEEEVEKEDDSKPKHRQLKSLI